MADIAAVAQWFVHQLHGFQMLPQVPKSPSIKEKTPIIVKVASYPYYRIAWHLWEKLKTE